MELLLQRFSPAGQPRTMGRITIYDAVLTLEDKVRKPGEAKVAGETAIPAGRYLVTLENSPRFGADTLTLTGFKGGHPTGDLYEVRGTADGFTFLRMHGVNTERDTEGCVGVGMEYLLDAGGKAIGIRNAAPALELLKNAARGARARGENAMLTIKDAFDFQ